MQQGIPREGAHSHSHQELQKVVVEDFLHDGNHCHTQQTSQGYHEHCRCAVSPHCHTHTADKYLYVLYPHTATHTHAQQINTYLCYTTTTTPTTTPHTHTLPVVRFPSAPSHMNVGHRPSLHYSYLFQVWRKSCSAGLHVHGHGHGHGRGHGGDAGRCQNQFETAVRGREG